MTLQTLGDQPIARWVNMLAPARQLAEVLAQTEFVSTALRGKPDAIAAAILYGDELGVDPMQALASIHVVEGKPQPSSELMRALILKAGHSLAVHEMTGTRARVSGLRAGRPESERVVVEWTMDMARAAGLSSRPPWRAYPRAMLLARSFGDLARVLFPDVIKGLSYVAEDDQSAADLEAWGGGPANDDDQAAVAAEKPRKAIQRKPRKAAAPVDPERPAVAPDEESRPSHVHDFGGPDGRCSGCSAIDPRRDDPPPAGQSGPPASGQPVGWTPEDVPLPDELQPQALQPEQVPPDPINSVTIRSLNTLLTRELGSAATRAERLSMLSAILGRQVESSKVMTQAEGVLASQWFDRLAEGQVAYDMDPETGAVSVRDVTP